MAKPSKKTKKKKKVPIQKDNVEIKTRLVLLAGPSSTGKTTLTNKLMWQASQLSPVRVSQDEIIGRIPKGLSPDAWENTRQDLFIMAITEALFNPSAKLIVFDTSNISHESLYNFLMTIHTLAGEALLTEITLLKLQIPKQRHLENARRHYPDDPDITSIVKEQRSCYEGPKGSLGVDYVSDNLVSYQFVIDPETTTFTFDFTRIESSFDFE